jgi:hypothetical protein
LQQKSVTTTLASGDYSENCFNADNIQRKFVFLVTTFVLVALILTILVTKRV